MKYFLSTVVLVTFACQATAQKCYSTDGSKLDSRYQPCFPQAEHSACCMLNGTQGDNQQNDICMDSGLCQATSGWYAGFLYINGCTDPANDAEGCPKLCSFMGNQYSWSVLQCEPGKFCCRAASDTDNCCNNNQSIISTSHIGSLLLPGSTTLINTTYNTTTGSASSSSVSSSENSTCSTNSSNTPLSSNSALIDRSQCPADKSATVGGAVGGVLGAALVGAIVALIFSLRSRKQTQNDLLAARTTLTTTETQAAEEKANHQKQLEDQQRHIYSMPPNYPAAFYPQSKAYPFRPPPPNEMDSSESRTLSELSSGPDGSRVELTDGSANSHW